MMYRKEATGGLTITVPSEDVAEFLTWISDENADLNSPVGKQMQELQDALDPWNCQCHWGSTCTPGCATRHHDGCKA